MIDFRTSPVIPLVDSHIKTVRRNDCRIYAQATLDPGYYVLAHGQQEMNLDTNASGGHDIRKPWQELVKITSSTGDLDIPLSRDWGQIASTLPPSLYRVANVTASETRSNVIFENAELSYLYGCQFVNCIFNGDDWAAHIVCSSRLDFVNPVIGCSGKAGSLALGLLLEGCAYTTLHNPTVKMALAGITIIGSSEIDINSPAWGLPVANIDPSWFLVDADHGGWSNDIRIRDAIGPVRWSNPSWPGRAIRITRYARNIVTDFSPGYGG